MSLNQEQLSKFRTQKERLGTMLADTANIISELKMLKASDNLKRLSAKVNNDTFRIMIVGTFSNGKSTLINALLGEEVLPAYARPTTAVINEVKYGEKKEAVLYFRDPLPEKLPSCIPAKAVEHMKAHGMKNIPPITIPYNEIEDYVVIPMGEDLEDLLLESPYDKVELFWPLDLLKEGVEIIDSPGLNETETRTNVTMNYLSNADAILFVMNACSLCSMVEMDFIKYNLQAYGFTDPFFVVNRFDLIRDKEKEEIKKFAHAKLDGYSSNEIYFVSAQDALDGEVEHDEQLYTRSNMGTFTRALSDFLTKDKGKIKLSQPARELKHILNDEALYKILPGQKAMLESSLDEVKKRFENAKPQIELLKAKKDQVINKMKLRIEKCEDEFREAAKANILSIAEKTEKWINAYEPKHQFEGAPTEAKSKAIANELLSYVTKEIEEQQAIWRSDTLRPLVKRNSDEVFGLAEPELEVLCQEIDLLGMQISDTKEEKTLQIPIWQRLSESIEEIAPDNYEMVMTEGIGGIGQDMLKTAILSVGAGTLFFFLGVGLPAIAGGLIFSLFHGGLVGNAMEKTKKKVIGLIQDKLNTSVDESSKQLSKTISEKMFKMVDDISSALGMEIDQIEQQVSNMIREMEQGQTNIDKCKKDLEACEQKVKNISTNLDAFIFDLIEQR